jgi:hypothetical protein
LAESQAALDTLQDVELNPSELAAWRRGVMERVAAGDRPQRRFAWPWVGAAAAAAAAVLLLAVAHVASRPAPPKPAPVVAHVAPPARPAVQRPPEPQPPPVAHVRRRPAKPKPAVKAEPLLVRLETSDPNVIIYWIAEGKGD